MQSTMSFIRTLLLSTDRLRDMHVQQPATPTVLRLFRLSASRKLTHGCLCSGHPPSKQLGKNLLKLIFSTWKACPASTARTLTAATRSFLTIDLTTRGRGSSCSTCWTGFTSQTERRRWL